MDGQLTTTFSGTFVVCYSSIYFYLLLKRVKFQKLLHPQLCVHCEGKNLDIYIDMLNFRFILFLFLGKLEKIISNQCKSNTMAMHKENTCVSKV